jgi:hypothetical protein
MWPGLRILFQNLNLTKGKRRQTDWWRELLLSLSRLERRKRHFLGLLEAWRDLRI